MSQPVACIPRVPVPPTMSTKPSAPKEKYERDEFWHDVVLAMCPLFCKSEVCIQEFRKKTTTFCTSIPSECDICPEFDKALDWLLIGKSV